MYTQRDTHSQTCMRAHACVCVRVRSCASVCDGLRRASFAKCRRSLSRCALIFGLESMSLIRRGAGCLVSPFLPAPARMAFSTSPYNVYLLSIFHLSPSLRNIHICRDPRAQCSLRVVSSAAGNGSRIYIRQYESRGFLYEAPGGGGAWEKQQNAAPVS